MRNDKIATAIRIRIAELKISQKKMSAEIGINEDYLSQKLNGHIGMNPKDLLKISKYLKMDLEELINL